MYEKHTFYQEKKAATLPRPKDRQKIEERRLEAEKKREERREREKEREKERIERMSKSETLEKEKQAVPKPLSKSFIERLSTPKHTSADKKETGEKEATPVKVSSVLDTNISTICANLLSIKNTSTCLYGQNRLR